LNATSTKKAKPPVAAKPQPKAKAVAAKTTKALNTAAKKPVAPVKSVAKSPPKANPPSAKKIVTTPVKSKPVSKVVTPLAAAKKPVAAPLATNTKPPAVTAAKPKVVVAKPPAPALTVVVPPKLLAPPPATVGPAAVPVKSGRPSSRLAQLTVPSMAQSVASTAAKSSFGPSGDLEPLTPVIPALIKKDSKLANNWKSKPVQELSDAELLAMPDSEYMNDVQMAAFRLKLVVLKRDILSNAGETTEHLREDTSVVPDPADRATIEEEHALELRTRDRERKLLKKIEQSIGRIDAGDYGYCDETGEAIGVGRLLARPTATLSLEAQQRRELKQKMFGD